MTKKGLRKGLLCASLFVSLIGIIIAVPLIHSTPSEEVESVELVSLIQEYGRPGIVPSPSLLESYRASGQTPPRVRDCPAPIPRDSVTGTRNILVIMIDFPDKAGTETKGYYDDLIFGTTQGKMKHYYTEVSYGLLTVTGTVAPGGWYTSAHDMVWWGEDTDTLLGWIDDANALIFELAREAVVSADADVDFSTYDVDGDDVMDPEELSLCIVHAGSGQEFTGNPDDIWSHRWYIFGAGYRVDGTFLSDTIVDGVRISKHPDDYVGGYFMQAEDSPMGTFAHEFGHDLGLPDLYDTDYSSDGIGYWGLMGGGSWLGSPAGTSPAHPCAWSKATLGWVTPTLVTSHIDDAPVPQVETNPTVYKMAISSTEYFLVENRRRTGYDSFLPGQGVLIWHIDELMPDNDDETHKMVDLEEADGLDQLDVFNDGNFGDSIDPWYSPHATSFTDTTYPNCTAYDASPTGCWVTDISMIRATMTADFISPTLISISQLDTYLLNAPANTVYFIFADPAYMTRAEATYDVASGGIVYGLCTNIQHLGFNTTQNWLLASGAINPATISGATVAMFGGRFPHVAVRYYEDAGLTPVKFAADATHYMFLDQGDTVVAALPIAAVAGGHEDMFVVEVFTDGDNTIFVVYGFDWRGTWAGGIYFKEVISKSLSSYPGTYYIFHWVDGPGQDGVPQSSEIHEEASG